MSCTIAWVDDSVVRRVAVAHDSVTHKGIAHDSVTHKAVAHDSVMRKAGVAHDTVMGQGAPGAPLGGLKGGSSAVRIP